MWRVRRAVARHPVVALGAAFVVGYAVKNGDIRVSLPFVKFKAEAGGSSYMPSRHGTEHPLPN